MTPVLPTTRAGAERAVLIAFVGWRVAVLAQILPAFPPGFAASQLPAGYAAAGFAVLAETIVVCSVSVARGRSIGVAWTWCEVVGACALLLASPLFVPAEHRIGSWIGFMPGFVLAIVGLAGAGLTRSRRHRWWQIGAASALAVVCYAQTTLPIAPEGLISTVVGNCLTYPTFAAVVGAVALFLRRLGDDADLARLKAGKIAEVAERQRHQLLLHDSAGILQLVSSQEFTDLSGVVRRQAAAESQRIRAFLSTTPEQGRGTASTLGGAVRSAAAPFGDLPIELVLDLGADVPLAADVSDALRGAVCALLHNVRLHAMAQEVVVHTDIDQRSGQWELSIRDDGRGYDMDATPPGFGLTVQVHHALAEHDISVEIASATGEGTVAVIRGHLG